MTKNRINVEIISQNFARMKYLNLILILFSIFSIVVDFSEHNPWHDNSINLYKILDALLLFLSLISAIFFWIKKDIRFSFKNIFISFYIYSFIFWTVIITYIDFSSLSFSSYIGALTVTILFFHFTPAKFITLIWGSAFLLLSLLYFKNDLTSELKPTFFVLFVLIAFATIIAWKNYSEKVNSIKILFEKEELNKKLNLAKESLKAEVEKQTKHLIRANSNLNKNKKQLKTEKDRFASLINNLQTGVFYINLKGDILELNPALLKILDSPSEKLTKAINIFTFQPLLNFGYSDKFKECIRTSKVVYGNGKYKSKWGKEIYVNYYFAPILEGNTLKGILASVDDITEKKRIEQDLIIAKERAEESDRLKTAFLKNLSHEIRTPLNAISGFAGILGNNKLTLQKRNQYSKIIQNSSDQLVSVVSDILTISSLETKQEEVHLSKVCINEEIEKIFSKLKKRIVNENLTLLLNYKLSNKESEIYTDKAKFVQILTILLSNALKFTKEGFIEFGYNLKHEELIFYVKDTGIGIKELRHFDIFETFSQANESIQINYGGMGLGLAISKGFINLLGGKIWVESKENQGSIFYFTIPYAPLLDNYKIEKMPIKNNEFKTILIAEDEDFNFLYIKELLIEENLKIIHAVNGKVAVELFKKNLSIDLVLMDIKMPLMEGDKAAKLIRELRPNVPIIAQSAYDLESKMELYINIFDDFLVKPIDQDTLLMKIKKYTQT